MASMSMTVLDAPSTVSDRLYVLAITPTGTAAAIHGILDVNYQYTHGLSGVNLPLNYRIGRILWYSLIFGLSLVFVVRIWQRLYLHNRRLYTLTATLSSHQSYWNRPSSTLYSWIRTHIFIAPLFTKRHHHALTIGRLTLGCLPSRLQTILLGLYIAGNLTFSFALLDFHQPTPHLLAEFRGRTGHLAVCNLLPLFLLAARNNPLTPLLRLSFDTFNTLHRWLGRLVVLQASLHVAAWTANQVLVNGAGGLWYNLHTDPFVHDGLLAVSALLFIVVMSPSFLRHAWYEFFLHTHRILAILVVVGVYLHVFAEKLPQMPVVWAIVGIWAGERTLRVLRILARNFDVWGLVCCCFGGRTAGRRGFMTTVTLEALEDVTRVTVRVARPWDVQPGTHLYLYVPRIGLYTSHPFSLAWASDRPVHDPALTSEPKSLASSASTSVDNLPATEHDTTTTTVVAPTATEATITLLVAPHKGFTRSLHTLARTTPHAPIRALVEGPYLSAPTPLSSYGTVLLVAAGVGITHQLPLLRALVAGMRRGDVAAKIVKLVWVVRASEHWGWVEKEWWDELLGLDAVAVDVYVTRGTLPVGEAREGVAWKCGRPDVRRVVDGVAEDGVGAIGVSVCGNGAIADDVRAAVRAWGGRKCVDLWEESFSW